MAPKTSDGYSWEKGNERVRSGGLECDGVIKPARSLGDKTNGTHVDTAATQTRAYDVIVIGAGYAGLAAARDLCNLGHSVLLLEARDRIGGRTYTVKKDGFLYEMGGTWVTHHMGYLLREMQRYGVDRDLITTGSPDMHKGYYTLDVPGSKPRKLTHEEAGAMSAKAWDLFVNVDGHYGRTLCPLPHAQLDNIVVNREVVEKWDQLSCADRLAQIEHKLTAEEKGLLVSLLLHISGGDMETSSLWDMIRSHALLMHSSDNFTDVWLRYKLREGQSELARRMFQDAVEAGLDYAFETPVKSVIQVGILVTTTAGESFRARKVVSTVPLNVLKDVEFHPPLSHRRREAIGLGHVNQMSKIHADVSDKILERWNGMRYPGPLMYGYADGVLPNGDVHLVAFGADEHGNFIPEKNPSKAVDALTKLHPMDVKKLLFHNWSTDPWSQGGPAWWRPGYMSKYQDELQSRHGDVFFASGDWAHGWRASIDGALEQGILNAQTVHNEIRQSKKNAAQSRL